jgi:ATP-dependent DNA helicase DinG
VKSFVIDKRQIESTDFDIDVEDIYGSGGPLDDALDGFLERPQQQTMASDVSNVLKRGENLLVEAGTGTGKSLAYLIPIAKFTQQTDVPVIVSTHTINLQEQLETSDIPLTQTVLDGSLDAALVKGRENYLCQKRLKKAWRERHLRFADNRKERQLERLMEWAESTDDGSRSDIDFTVHGDVWSQVCSKRGVCRCLNDNNTNCFYARSRRAIKDADILLVNHYLFMQDLAQRLDSGFGVLPRYGAVVLDEAHHIERVARQCFGLEISYLQFKYLRRDLLHPEKETGLLAVTDGQHLSEKVNRLDREVEAFFNDVRAFHHERSDSQTGTLRVYESGIVHNSLDPVLSDLLRGLRDHHENADLSDDDQDELKSMINRVTSLKESLEIYLQQAEENDVYWIERSDYRDNVTLRSSPVDVGELLRDEFFDPVYASIMTSATMTTPSDDPFAYVRDRMGLDSPNEKQLGHPFDYHNQVTLQLVSDLTSPSDSSNQFTQDTIEWLKGEFDETTGQTFVLFTSYRMLNTVADAVREDLEANGIELLVQGGDLSRRRMLKEFRNNQPAIIFGADAFWEGVDVRGDDLNHVIITKLPFPNPSNPLVEATSEQLEQEGKNPFMDYFLPEAILSLKQGFGRLIRSRNDTGKITILDSRILNKRYGHHFLDALPDCKTVYDSLENSNTPPQ